MLFGVRRLEMKTTWVSTSTKEGIQNKKQLRSRNSHNTVNQLYSKNNLKKKKEAA